MKIKRYIYLIVAVALILCACVTGLIMNVKINSMTHENIAKSFSMGTRYAQISVFLPESAGLNFDNIMYLRYNIEQLLTEKAVTSENSQARLYIDAFSATGDISLTSDSFRTATLKAIYAGGDYKIFHPHLEYMPDISNDLNHDRILISKDAAWSLYGGYELYDFSLTTADETNYYISGVYDAEKGKQYELFRGGRPECILDFQKEPNKNATCYEILIVNPVNDFAMQIVKKSIETVLGMKPGDYICVENSSRFAIPKLFDKMTSLTSADKQNPAGVVVPPEEILSIETEKELALLLALLIVLLIYPAIIVLVFIYRGIRFIKGLWNKYVIDKIRDKFSYS